mgnify:CR=1 FL=1
MPGMPEAVFLEGLIVRNTALDTFAKVIDGRGREGRSDSRCGCWSLSAPILERLVFKSKSMRHSGRRVLTEPREEGVEFLHLDVSELMIFITKRVYAKANVPIISGISGNEI